MVTVEEPQTWVRIDEFGRLEETFYGTVGRLTSQLRSGREDVAIIRALPQQNVYLPHLCAIVSCSMVELEIPWGTYRWIPTPADATPRRHDWLAGLMPRR